MGAATRSCLTLDELTDLKTAYGISVAAQVHEAWDIGMISRKHYDWWYDGPIRDNIRETGWGAYPLPETIGRERRIDSRIKMKIDRCMKQTVNKYIAHSEIIKEKCRL